MHYESHIFAYCIAFWCVINVGETARSAINPEILANFAKNVATVLSPVVLGDIQSRRNRSSLQSVLTEPLQLDEDNSDSSSSLDNIVDNTSNAGSYYRPDSYPYNGLYENSAERLEESDEQLKESLRDESYLRQERPNFYRPYDFPANNAKTTEKSVNTADIESSAGNIEQSSTNLFSSYHDFPKAAFHGVNFLAKPHPGFYGFGPYGHGYHHHHHHHPYGSGESGEAPENGTDHRGYGPPFGGHGYGHPYSPFPYYGGYGSFYGPYGHNGNNSNGHHGPYHGGPDFYGPPYGHGYNRNNGNNNNNNNNGNNNNNRQTEEPADNGDQNNSTTRTNGYPYPYGPPFVKPVLGFPFPFSPFHHFHGGFKGGPVVGVGYPLYADPYLIGFPFHHPYGPFFYGKKYLPKGKPDSGESGETTEAAPAGELSENENPERITALNNEEAAPAPSSNQYRSSGRKGLVSLINFERKV